jgi:hypothetical protein
MDEKKAYLQGKIVRNAIFGATGRNPRGPGAGSRLRPLLRTIWGSRRHHGRWARGAPAHVRGKMQPAATYAGTRRRSSLLPFGPRTTPRRPGEVAKRRAACGGEAKWAPTLMTPAPTPVSAAAPSGLAAPAGRRDPLPWHAGKRERAVTAAGRLGPGECFSSYSYRHSYRGGRAPSRSTSERELRRRTLVEKATADQWRVGPPSGVLLIGYEGVHA